MFLNTKIISNNSLSLIKKKTMKKLLLIIGITLSLQVSAQYSNQYKYAPPKGWASPELYLPTTILISTFAINHDLGKSVSYGTRSTIAATGMITSVATHFIFRKIRESKKSNRKLLTLK